MALEKQGREVEEVKAKEESTKTVKNAGEKAMEVYKTSMDFVKEKARVVAIFWMLKEFCDDHHQFSKENFLEGLKLG